MGDPPEHLDAVTTTVTQMAHPAFTTRQPGSFMLSLEAPEYLSAARETPDGSIADPDAPGGELFPVPPLPCQ